MRACTAPSQAACSETSLDDVKLTCRALVVGRQGKSIFDLGDWNPQPGKIHAVLGENGSGKTTLLDTLCGLIPPISGEVTIRGSAIHQLRPEARARLISSVPQKEMPSEGFTLREVVVMGRTAIGEGLWESAEDWYAADAALAKLDLDNLKHQRADQVSGGEMQRALIARSLATSAPILTLDEPTSSIDIHHLQRLGEILVEETKPGRTLLVSTHNLEWAAAFADSWLMVGKDGAKHCHLLSELEGELSRMSRTKTALIDDEGRISLSMGYLRP